MSLAFRRFLGLALLSIAASPALALGQSKEPPPAPPQVKSGIGYLHVAEDVSVEPKSEKTFIPPQSRLMLLDETPQEYHFVLEGLEGSVLCRVPKISRFTTLMRFDSDDVVTLRGVMEAENLPLRLPAGSELPVLRKEPDGWTALLLPRKGLKFKVFVPSGSKGVEFSAKSMFEIFSAEQEARGLAYCDGKWIPEAEAKAAKAAAEEAAKGKEARMELLRKSAAAGYVVLDGGHVLEGSFKGADGSRILFETASGDRWISSEDIAPMSLDEALAVGRLQSGRGMLEKAKSLHRDNKFGESMRVLDGLRELMKEMPPGTKTGSDSFAALFGEAASLRAGIDKILENEGMALHQYKLFPKEALLKHLAEGHVLLKGIVWVERGQICSRCQGSGTLDCPLCKGAGCLTKVCPNCKSGLTTCSICNGTGWRQCAGCNGAGSFSRICSRCGGSGTVWRASGIRGVEPGSSGSGGKTTIIGGGGGMAIVSRPPAFVNSDNPYRYIQERCPLCEGTGIEKIPCAKCGGKGSIPCPKLQKCPFCKGKGSTSSVCPECNGQGKIECPDCQGKGFLGSPQVFEGEPPATSQQESK